jgi:hypothetical protein
MTAEPRTDISGPPPGPGFSGYAGDAPSGLRYAGQSGFAPPPQAAYPDPNLSRPPGELPGYLSPYPPPDGFSGRGPSVRPVVAFTLFFGVFGALSAHRRAQRAEAAGDSPGRYWIAFGVTLSLAWVVGAILSILWLAFGGVLAVSAASPAPAHPITAAELSRSMVEDGTFTGKGGKTAHVKAATCAARSVDSAGAGDYRCAVTLTDATVATLRVHADASGWRVLGQTK